MNQPGIRLLCPAPRGRTNLIRKNAHRNRDGDVVRGEEVQLVLPIQTRGTGRLSSSEAIASASNEVHIVRTTRNCAWPLIMRA
jgi:hypothetical protein